MIDGRQKLAALGGVLALHAGAAAALVVAQLNRPAPPTQPTLSVSFVTELQTSVSPEPPQPPAPSPPLPEPRLMATPQPTDSPMTAPPPEREPPRQTPPQPVQSAPQPSAPPASAAPAAAAITPPNFTAAYLNNPGPAYPYASRRKREQGVVRLRVQVNADGSVSQVMLDRSSGFADLDAAALEVVKRRWRFAPARQGDRPVSAWVVVPMEFSLKDR